MFAWIATHRFAYPLLEALHIVGVAVLLGSLVLRVLGPRGQRLDDVCEPAGQLLTIWRSSGRCEIARQRAASAACGQRVVASNVHRRCEQAWQVADIKAGAPTISIAALASAPVACADG